MGVLAKHLAGTEYDHDQQSHAGGGGIDTDYRGQHTSPDRDFGAPAHDMAGFYPDDVYTPQGLRYYGQNFQTPTFDDTSPNLDGNTQTDLDRFAWQFLQDVRGNPEQMVPIYRAVPLEAPDRIAPNDWVTISREYARDHGISALQESFKIVSAEVPAKDLFTNGDSWLEWGWDPEGSAGPIGSTSHAVRDGVRVDVSTVTKHLAGTENDHDQQSHAGGGSSSSPKVAELGTKEFVDFAVAMTKNQPAKVVTESDNIADDDFVLDDLSNSRAAKNAVMKMVASEMTDLSNEELISAFNVLRGSGSSSSTNIERGALNAIAGNTPGLTGVVVFFSNDTTLPYVTTYENDLYSDPVGKAEREAMKFDLDAGKVFYGELGEPAIAQQVNEALKQTVASNLVSEWARSSNGSNVSRLVQHAAQKEFGLDSAVTPDAVRLSGFDPRYTESDVGALEKVTRSFVRAQYTATQKALSEQFPNQTHFALHRGGDQPEHYTELSGTAGKLQDATLALRPLASFSTGYSIARIFGMGSQDPTAQGIETIFSAAVPKERIFSTPLTGNGALKEQEFVVLGGPIAGKALFNQSRSVAEWASTTPPSAADLPLGATEFITINGQPVPIGKSFAKHLAGTVNDHDQQSHAGGGSSTSVPATGGRAEIVKVSDTTYEYEYGDFSFTTDITDPQFLAETGLNRESTLADNPATEIQHIGEFALNTQWNQWEGNFAMRHLSAAMMGLDHQYASGGQDFNYDIQQAILYGERPADEGAAEYAEGILRDHAATTHAMLQTIADGPDTMEYADSWDGIVRRGMTVTTNEFGEGPLFYVGKGDTLDLALSGFTPDVTLLETFLRGGERSREYMQPDDEFVFTPNWRSVMFELDTSKSHYVAPADWQANPRENQVYVSWDDRDADFDAGSLFARTVTAPAEVVTAGKFRVSGVRDETRQFTPMFTGGSESISEDMRVITLQQTAVYNPRTNTYDALDGFITLPDGQVVPIEES